MFKKQIIVICHSINSIVFTINDITFELILTTLLA